MKTTITLALSLVLIGCQGDKAEQYVQTLGIAEQGLSAITIDTASATVREPNTTTQWSASASLSTGDTLDYSDLVNWSSDAPAVATVSSGGEIKTLSAGVANIRASYGRLSDVQAFTVSTAVLQSISLSPDALSLDECKSALVTARGSYDDGTTRDINDLLTWSTDNSAIATVQNQSSTGITVVSHNAGTGALTAINNDGISGTASLTILDTLSGITIDKPALELAVGDSATLAAQGEYTDNSSADISQASDWRLLDAEQSRFVSLDNSFSNKGNLKATAAGAAAVKVTCGGLEAAQNSSITVLSEATLQNLSISPSDNPYVLSTSDTDKSLTVFANYTDGRTPVDVTADAIWEVLSGDTDFIEIDTSDGNEGDILLDDNIGSISEDKSILVQISYASQDAQIQITVEAP